MKLKILDYKQIDSRIWYLCKGNLLEYLEGLKEDFYDFAVQRKIVENQYLDKLYTTIKSGDPIPLITLTYKENKLDKIGDDLTLCDVDLTKIEILDGLQRSFRLWAYLNVSKEYTDSDSSDARAFSKRIKENNPLFFETGVISTKLVKKLIEDSEITKIEEIFSNYDIYFTIWCGLSEKEIIQKMLVLNAGQKSVSKTHQFELLFLHFYNAIKENSQVIGVKLFRDKDTEATDIRRGIRNVGEFMFSSIIVSLQSFIEGKPLRVSTEKLIENEFIDDDPSESIYSIVFNETFIIEFLRLLTKLDQSISDSSEKGKEWFSKDTTLSGILAAIGKYVNPSSLPNAETLRNKTKETFQKLESELNKSGYQLDKFTNEYNNLSSRSVNIGTFIRSVIMNYTLLLLNGESPNWSSEFSKLNKK